MPEFWEKNVVLTVIGLTVMGLLVVLFISRGVKYFKFVKGLAVQAMMVTDGF